ncbi:MAG: MBL fold metallo-hydrolase [Parvibaculum sp.]|nr:MBL fold metallo-hydrolase [Parvibaculum sp.]
MSVWKRNILVVLAVLVAIGGGAYYWFVVESHMPSDAAFELDINEVRRLADEMPGNKPAKIQVEQIGAFSFPSTAVVAGDGWKQTAMPVFSYQLVFPDGKTGIIDTALSKEQGGENLGGFDADAYARMSKALGAARFVIITHEHMDHMGGISAYPDFAQIAPVVALSQEQIDHPERSGVAALSAENSKLLTPVVYDKYKAIAPGVVLIKSPGHSPGSQMVYVRKADGREVLFLGDVAWHFRNIEVLRERARLVTQFFLYEDRKAVFGQLKALSELDVAEPNIAIVPGHDGMVMASLLSEGVLSKGFE